jgi:hypothetical protein
VQFQTVPNIYVYHVAGSISKYIQLCARQILYLTKLIPSSRPRYLLKITMVICMYVYIHDIYIYVYKIYIILYYIILYEIILYYIILYYIVL